MPARSRFDFQKGLKRAFAPLALAVALTLDGGYSAFAQTAGAPVYLTMPVLYGTHLPGLGKPARDWALLTQKLSGKTLRISILQPGEGPDPQDLLDAVSEGKVDAAFSKASFWADRLPAASLFAGFPFGPDAAGYAAWFHGGDGLRLYQEMYDEAGLSVHVLPCAFGGAETSGWYAKQLQTPDDIDGLRIRIFGQGGLVMRRLGAVPALVPGSKLTEAFKSDEIDAAEFYPPAVDAQANLGQTAKYVYVPGWHQPETVMELLINKDRWNALSDRQQSWIETACRATLLNTMAENPVLASDALKGFAAEGVEIKTWPAPLLKAFRQSWEEIAADEARRDEFFAEVLDDLRAFRARQTPGLEGSQSETAEPLTASTDAEDAPDEGSAD
ncbi:TRAP transporter substrate-binding protein [Methyloligella solikamskensis]|uniref:TRAP transporter substrate-binding protein n=1 Tax=Methyloligella solikamskensis TaxID=1177756 RepID=A0ABW3JDI2_9HYPH